MQRGKVAAEFPPPDRRSRGYRLSFNTVITVLHYGAVGAIFLLVSASTLLGGYVSDVGAASAGAALAIMIVLVRTR